MFVEHILHVHVYVRASYIEFSVLLHVCVNFVPYGLASINKLRSKKDIQLGRDLYTI